MNQNNLINYISDIISSEVDAERKKFNDCLEVIKRDGICTAGYQGHLNSMILHEYFIDNLSTIKRGINILLSEREDGKELQGIGYLASQ